MNNLGQHFLNDASTIRKIIGKIHAAPGETIIEIGPGRGALTFELQNLAKKSGARFIAVEKDPELANELQARGVTTEQGDALKLLPRLARGKYKIVGNIPYYITGHLLRIISENDLKPSECIFMVQKEVALRIAAEPPRMNRLAASVQFWAHPEIVAQVSRRLFVPAPKVDSAVLRLITYEKPPGINSEAYYKMMRMVFAQPRKTILNNLQSPKTGIPKSILLEKLENMNIPPDYRPQNLTVSHIILLAREICG